MQEPFSEYSEDLNLTGTVINEDDILDDYEPSEREINSYALQLGMDPHEDQEYLYLAKEGLKAPIPKPWTACRTKDGKIFYYNFETEESQWEHPLDQNYKEKFVQVKYNHTKGSMSPISINIQTVENQNLESQNNNTERIEFTAESQGGDDMIDSLEFSDIQSKNRDNNNFQQVLSFDESRQSLHFVVEKAGNKIKQQVKQQGEKKSSSGSGGSSKEYIGSGENILDKALVMGQSDNEDEQEANSERFFGEYFDTEGAWQRTDGDERTPGEVTLKEIEVEALEAFQKYEDDLKSQFSYVISQFEQNYQKHAAKIEEQYQKEIKKLEQEIEQENNLEDQMKTFETEAREQYEKDLKSQIKDLNKAYENMRGSMEEKAESEIQHCLEEVREKWNVEIHTISKNVMHRRTKSASIKPEVPVPEYQLDNRRSSWGYMDSVKANSSFNFGRLGQEILFDFGKDCERFARDVQKSLKDEIKIIDVEKQEYRKSLTNTKSIMERHYKQKFQENKRKLEEEFVQNQSDSSCSSNNYDNSLSCSIVENSEIFAKARARGPELLKQLNSIKQPNKQARQERELKSELKQLEEDLFYRSEYVDFMNKLIQKTSLVNKDVQAKEKAVKVLEKEINEIEKDIASYKRQAKMQQSNLDELRQQEIEKDHLSLKTQTISSKIEKIDKEIETLKHTPIIPAVVVYHQNQHQPKDESQKDLSKILNGIKELKDLAKYKSRKSVGGSAEKSRKSSSPNKHNRTIEYNPTTNYSQQIETNIDDSIQDYISVSPFSRDEPPKRSSQAINYEWEEEEKSYDHDGRSRTREFSRGLPPPQLEKCPQSDFEWKVFLETEQSRISIYMIALQRKKYDLRKSQDELEKDHNEYKHDYLAYKHDKNKRTYTRRLQLENRKKCLNQRIKKYNEILFWIREQENILASKKDILKNIEKTFEEAYRCQGLDEDTLGYLHRVYKGINLDDYNLITEKSSSPMRTRQDEEMYLTSKSSANYASYAKIHNGMVKEKEKMLWSRGGNLKQLTLE